MKFFIARNRNMQMNSHLKGLLLVFGLGAIPLHAQQTNELLLHVNGPVSILEYDGVDNKVALDDGVGFGIEFGRYLSTKWSLRTGVALQTYRGNAKLDVINGAYLTQDSEAEAFEFRYRFIDYRETQTARYIQIPLLAQYETSGTNRLFASAGVKLGILAESQYEAEATRLTTAGYYEQYDALLEAPRFAGFGNFGSYSWEAEDLALKTNVMLSVETGLKLPVTQSSLVYLSVYLDYGLTNVFDDTNSNRLLEYNAAPEVNFTGNSVLTTQAGNVDKIKTLSFGFKLKYGFGF